MYSVFQMKNRTAKIIIIGLICALIYGYRYHATTANDEAYWISSTTNDHHSSESDSDVNQSFDGVREAEEPNPKGINSSLESDLIEILPSSSASSLKPSSSPSFTENMIETSSENQLDTTAATNSIENLSPKSESEICPEFGKGMDLLILILSAPDKSKAREAIRLTWGHFGRRKDIGIAFLLGNTTDVKINENIANEISMYGDIIERHDFIDSYTNLTRKVISGFKWISDNCPGAKFVLKTDDDMFINVPRLLEFVKTNYNEENIIFGRLVEGWEPHRDPENKYFVPTSEYNMSVYPPFTTGPAYLLSGDVITKLYKTASISHFIRLEDVFITGMVAQKLGIRLRQNSEFVNDRIKFVPCKIQHTISIHAVKYSEQFDLWKKLLDGVAVCNNE